jgi:hypothetical protein
VVALAFMKSVLAVLTLALTLTAVSRAEDTVAVGRAISQRGIENVEICGEGEVCLGGWVRWEIQVGEILSGPSISGRIKAAFIQTSLYVPSSVKMNRAFVLRRIEDPTKRKLLGADFFLVDRSTEQEAYCFSSKPESAEQSEAWFENDTSSTPYCIVKKRSDE